MKKEELSENRQKAIRRLYKLVYCFVDEMLNEEDKEQREAEEFRRRCETEPNSLQFRVSAHDNNVNIIKDCVREVRDAVGFLQNRENIIEEWQLAAINAMLDQCSMENIIPFDLPAAIKGVLCMHILCKPLCIEAAAG